MAKAAVYLGQFAQNYTFYHALGMTCKASHGKLHQSQFYVESLLTSHGFQIEHENVYYVLDLQTLAPPKNAQLRFSVEPDSKNRHFAVKLEDAIVGAAHARYLDVLTDSATSDALMPFT